MTAKQLLSLLESKAPQESFTFEEILKMVPQGPSTRPLLRDRLKELANSGDLLPFGRPGDRSWIVISPIVS